MNDDLAARLGAGVEPVFDKWRPVRAQVCVCAGLRSDYGEESTLCDHETFGSGELDHIVPTVKLTVLVEAPMRGPET